MAPLWCINSVFGLLVFFQGSEERFMSIKASKLVGWWSSVGVTGCAISVTLVGAMTGVLHGGVDPCENSWLSNTFTDNVNGAVVDMARFDDGDGEAMYVGGTFTFAGGQVVNRVVRWDGDTWSALAGGLNGDVLALAVYDDGRGPALYAAGEFTTAGGNAANHIARWDGTSWSPLGSGINGQINSLQVYDDGTGEALYAGGNFSTAGGNSAFAIARWDGQNWSSVGGSIGGTVFVMEVIDLGDGPTLYVGGSFNFAGGLTVSNIATWDGQAWAGVGAGFTGTVRAMTVHEDMLYLGGPFTTSGSQELLRVARWDGQAFSTVGDGFSDRVMALASHDDGSGHALYAGGLFSSSGSTSTSRVAVFRDGQWVGVGNGADNSVLALHSWPMKNMLMVGGLFNNVPPWQSRRIAAWQGPAPPVIDEQPDDVHATPGETVSFSIVATSSGPMTYHWRKNGELLIPKDDPRISGIQSDTLQIEDAQSTDAGEFDVLISNGCVNLFSESAMLVVESAGIVGDLNGDGVVNVSDLLLLLGAWGPCSGQPCPADLNGDGVVNVSDLLVLLANWG